MSTSSVQFIEGLFLRFHDSWGVWLINGNVDGVVFHLSYAGSNCDWVAGPTPLSGAQKTRVRRRFNQYVRSAGPTQLPWLEDVDSRQANAVALRRATRFYRHWCNRYRPGGGYFSLNIPVDHATMGLMRGAFEHDGVWLIGQDGNIAAVQQWLEPEDLAEWQAGQQRTVA